MIKKAYLFKIILSAIILCPMIANASYWEQCSDFGGGKRAHLKIATVDGKIYTGLGLTDNSTILDWWEYDTIQNKWTEKAVPPFEERKYNEVVAVGQKIFVGLGTGLENWWEYNIIEDSWSNKKVFPGYLRFGRSSSSSNNHHAYVYYKYTEHQIWEYDPTLDSWNHITNYPGGNNLAAMIALDDKIFFKGTESNEFWEYNLITSSWNQKADFGKVSYSQTSGILYKGEIYIVALKFYSDTNTNAGIWKYDMQNDSWTRLSNSDFPGNGSYTNIVVACDNFIYIGMGQQESMHASDFWKYNPTSEINTLKKYVTPSAGGFISLSPSQSWFQYTENVTLQAIPYTDYVFTGWSEDSCNDAYSSCTITMDSDKSIIAKFEYSTPTQLVDYQGSWQPIPMAYTVSDIHYDSEIQVQNSGHPVIAYAKNMGKDVSGWTVQAVHVAFWNGTEWMGKGNSNIENGISEEELYSLGDSGIKMDIDSHDLLHVSWGVKYQAYNIYHTFLNENVWQSIQYIDKGGNRNVFALDSNNYPIVAWEDHYAIKLLKWNGECWIGIGGSDSESGLSQSGNANSPFDMAVNQYDNIFVTYVDRTIGTWCTYLKYWDGSNWTGLDDSDKDGGLGIHQGYAYIALKKDGWPILAWSEGNRVICKEWTGNKWINLASNIDGTVYSGYDYCQLYGIYLTNDNYPTLCWSDGDIFSSSREYFCKKWNGTTWINIGNPTINYYLNQLYSNSEIKSFGVNNDYVNLLLRNDQSDTFDVLTISPQSERLYGLSININPSLNSHFSPCASITKIPDKQFYTYGENVTLVATPGCCYEFMQWSGDATGNRLEITITMDSDKNIIANFEKKTKNWKCGWEARNPYPTEIWEHTAEVINGKIYVLGGTSSSSVGDRNSISTVREYNPYLNKWTTKSPMNIARRNHTSEVVNNKIYVFGGFSENDDHLSSVEEYDPLTDKWTIKKNMLATRTFAGTTSIENNIYLYGGRRNDEGSNTKIMEMYDVYQNTWTTKSSLPEGIWFTDGVLINGKIHIISYDDYLVYNPDNDSWTSLPSYNEDPNFFMNCKNIKINNNIFVINEDTFYSYDVESGQWNDKLPGLCNPRSYIAVTILDKKIYAIGGLYSYESPQTSSNTVEVFDYSNYNKPFIYDINNQTTDENLPITIPVFIGNADDISETAICNLNLFFDSSEVSLISSDNITYTCLQNTFYISLSPITEIGGVATITITASDDEKNLKSSTSFELKVLPVNDVPEAHNAKISTSENQVIIGQLNSFDKDGVISLFSIVSNPTKGIVVINNNGSFTYTPSQNQYGEDSFSYKVYDSENAESNTAIVSIFITPINAPPLAYGKDIIIDGDVHINISLVANDPDNDTITYHILSFPTYGTISLTGANALYTPITGYYGPDNFSFKVNDGKKDSNIAIVTIQINPISTTRHFKEVNGNPADDTWTVYLSSATLDGLDLQPNDEIAIFDNQTLVGSFKIPDLLSGATQLKNYLTAWSTLSDGDGYQAGKPYTFKCWDISQQKEYTCFNPILTNPFIDAYTGTVFPEGDAKYSIVSLNFLTSIEQTIELSKGYQLISLNVKQDNTEMTEILSAILNDLDFAKDSKSNMLRRIGPEWVNNIGQWKNTEGYLLRMTNNIILNVKGLPINPETPIDLNPGYQFVAYFLTEPNDPIIAFSDILDHLYFAKDSYGNVIRKIGPSWVNNIGVLNPGEGYLLKMNAEDSLCYEKPDRIQRKSYYLKDTETISHFGDISGNPADATWTIYLAQALINETHLEANDEIAIFAGNKPVGAFQLTEPLTDEKQHNHYITAWSTLNDGDGYASGNTYTFKCWDASEGFEYSIYELTLTNPYNDAYTDTVFPFEDGTYSIAKFVFTEKQHKTGDMNDDGIIDLKDALWILKILVGVE